MHSTSPGSPFYRPRIIVFTLVVVFATVATVAGFAWGAQNVTKSPSVKSAASFSFTPDPVGAVATQHELFKVGETGVFASCGRVADDPNTGDVDESGVARFMGITAGSHGAIFATTEAGSVEVPAGASDAFLADAVDNGLDTNAAYVDFAIFDGTGTSASGSGGLLIEVAANKCTVTAEAAG